jgi:hypothetical protein
MKPLTLLLCCLAQKAVADDLCSLAVDLNRVVVAETGYVPVLCPAIGFTAVPPAQSLRSQAGAYLPASGQIELAPDLDLATAYGQSYLLHELVHAAQFANGADTRVPCPAALEAEAYTVQASFLRQHGLGQDALLVSLLAGQLGSCGRTDN